MNKLIKAVGILVTPVIVVGSLGMFTPVVAQEEGEEFSWYEAFAARKAAEEKVVFHMYSGVEFYDTESAPPSGNATFDEHVFETFFGYTVSDKVFAKLILEYEHVLAEMKVEQAEINITPVPNTTFAVGAILVPFGLENYKHAPSNNPLVTRPRAFKSGGMFPNTWTDVGIQVIQTLPHFGYLDLYYVNGDAKNGQVTRDNQPGGNNGKSVGLELQAREVVKGLNFGASYVTGPWGTYTDVVSGVVSKVDSNRWGVHAEYKAVHGVPLLLTAEYVAGADERASSVTGTDGNKKDKDVAGYYVTLGFDPISNLTALARFGAWDNDKDKTDNNKTEQTYGLRWKMYPGTYLKGEYRVTKNDPVDAEDNQVGIQLAVAF